MYKISKYSVTHERVEANWKEGLFGIWINAFFNIIQLAFLVILLNCLKFLPKVIQQITVVTINFPFLAINIKQRHDLLTNTIGHFYEEEQAYKKVFVSLYLWIVDLHFVIKRYGNIVFQMVQQQISSIPEDLGGW